MPRKGQKKQAVTTAPAKHYGDTARAVMQQKTIPLPAAPGPPPVTAPASAAGAAPAAAPDPNAAGGGPFAGELPGLTDPTSRPNEPVTQGLPSGPGAGPEVLRPPEPLVQAAAALNMLGTNADADTRRLRNVVNLTLKNGSAE